MSKVEELIKCSDYMLLMCIMNLSNQHYTQWGWASLHGSMCLKDLMWLHPVADTGEGKKNPGFS